MRNINGIFVIAAAGMSMTACALAFNTAAKDHLLPEVTLNVTAIEKTPPGVGRQIDTDKGAFWAEASTGVHPGENTCLVRRGNDHPGTIGVLLNCK